ncbi:MAG: ABC transporter ATP-binding protein [Methanoregula sp.]|nr:ABC transporter ATP-binding protein [Methanoregula sp.]
MIILEDVSKTFQDHTAVDHVSLEIPDHACVALLGPSGSGKTTLLRLIAGLEMPDEGTISMSGRVVSSPDVFVSPSERRIGFVFQAAALWPHKTVAGNILFALDALPEAEQHQRLVSLLDRMGISTLRDRYPDQISGGEARRVALARALAPRPETLLFDEPLTNLDRPLREDLLRLIAESVRANGSTMLYVTHDEYEATAVADTIIRFDKGRIVR